MIGRPTFLKWALVNVAYLLALAGGALAYHGTVETPGKIAIGMVLAVYALGSAHAGHLAWKWSRRTQHVSFAIELCPKLAMLGTVSGFLIAFGSSAGDVQHRIIGASTGLAATFVGISSMIVLEVQRHLLEHRND